MFPFRLSRKRAKVTDIQIERSEKEVAAIQDKVRDKSVQAKGDIERLNRLLRADGITLKIHIAAGGGRHG